MNLRPSRVKDKWKEAARDRTQIQHGALLHLSQSCKKPSWLLRYTGHFCIYGKTAWSCWLLEESVRKRKGKEFICGPVTIPAFHWSEFAPGVLTSHPFRFCAQTPGKLLVKPEPDELELGCSCHKEHGQC